MDIHLRLDRLKETKHEKVIHKMKYDILMKEKSEKQSNHIASGIEEGKNEIVIVASSLEDIETFDNVEQQRRW